MVYSMWHFSGILPRIASTVLFMYVHVPEFSSLGNFKFGSQHMNNIKHEIKHAFYRTKNQSLSQSIKQASKQANKLASKQASK